MDAVSIRLSRPRFLMKSSKPLRPTVDYSSFRSLPWDKVPRAGFMAYADCQESTYCWHVWDSETIDNIVCENSGSGNQSLEKGIC